MTPFFNLLKAFRELAGEWCSARSASALFFALVVQACAPTPEPVASPAAIPPASQSTTAEVSDMPTPPWSIVFADASGNSFHFLQPSADATAEFEYTPVTPERSSSGTYSGGMAARGELTPTQVQQIWTKMRELRADTASHVENRMMGTGSFRVSEDGQQYDFIVQSGPSVAEFTALVAPLRD